AGAYAFNSHVGRWAVASAARLPHPKPSISPIGRSARISHNFAAPTAGATRERVGGHVMDGSATNQKISWFRKEESAGTLDLSPQFQRRPVWTEEQASYLIDTILSGLPIPEIYIRSSSSPQGETCYEVVDGQ